MALADEIRALRDRAIGDLTAAHDYYTDTKTAWQIVRNWVTANTGNAIRFQNVTTGTVTTGADLAGKAQGYVSVYLAEATFQQFMAIFETFLTDFLRAWLMANPTGLRPEGKKDKEMTVGLSAILDARDKESLIRSLVERRVGGVMYARPTAWFSFLKRVTRISNPTREEIALIAEAKATRDVLVHNRGIVGQQYLEKVGAQARAKVDDRIEISESYHQETWELLRKVVTDVATAAERVS